MKGRSVFGRSFVSSRFLFGTVFCWPTQSASKSSKPCDEAGTIRRKRGSQKVVRRARSSRPRKRGRIFDWTVPFPLSNTSTCVYCSTLFPSPLQKNRRLQTQSQHASGFISEHFWNHSLLMRMVLVRKRHCAAASEWKESPVRGSVARPVVFASVFTIQLSLSSMPLKDYMNWNTVFHGP